MAAFRVTTLAASLISSLTLVLPLLARAQSASPSTVRAAALESQVRDTLVSLTGGAVPFGPRPVELTPEGDHYLMRVPLKQLGKVEPIDAAFTARVRLVDNSRWSIEDQQFPAQFKITGQAMVPDAPDAKNPNPDGKHTEPVVYDIKLGQQVARGVFDPSFASATDSTAAIGPIDVLRTSTSAAGLTHVDHLTSQTSARPTGGARIDLLSDTTANGYATESELPDGTLFKMTSKTIHVTSGISGLAHDKIIPLVHQAVEIAKIQPMPDGPGKQTAISANLRSLIGLARDLLTGGRLEELANDVRFNFGGHAGSFAAFDLALNGDAPQDMLTATMQFSLDGLVVEDLPPALAAYVPTHIALRPTLSNLSVHDLTAMATAAASADPGKAPSAPDSKPLFSHGGVNFGFESLGLDVAGTHFAGNGKFVLAGPDTVTGEAEISAQGLDALITRAQADPMLATGVPVVIFLKGIAHTSGELSVWQISVANRKVLINGVDLSAMAGAFK